MQPDPNSVRGNSTMNLICTLVHPVAVICIMQSHAMVMCYSVSILAGPALAYPSLG